jgi:hypothetical protein
MTIKCLYEHDIITDHTKANELLASAGMLPLTNEPFDKWSKAIELDLYNCLSKSNSNNDYSFNKKLNKVLLKRIISVLGVFMSMPAFIYYYYITDGWYLRIWSSDDVNVILVNNQIIAVDSGRYDNYLPKIISLDKHLLSNENNTFTFVNLNGMSRAWWDFELYHNNEIKWEDERTSGDEYQVNFAESVIIKDNGYLEAVHKPNINNLTIDPIFISIHELEKLVLILINDHVVAGATGSPSGKPDLINISPFLKVNQINYIELKFWAKQGPYKWHIEIKYNDIFWRCLRKGTQNSEINYSEYFTVDLNNNLNYTAQKNGTCINNP